MSVTRTGIAPRHRGGRATVAQRIGVKHFWASYLSGDESKRSTNAVSTRRSSPAYRARSILVMVAVDGERYLVSMLGEEVDWVRNVKAAGGDATLRHGRREEVRLEEVTPDRRAPVLKAYLKRAPGARPHLPIHKGAPLSEFEQVSSQFPVFRVLARNVEGAPPDAHKDARGWHTGCQPHSGGADPASFANIIRIRSGGRGRLPVWVVRKHSVLTASSGAADTL